MSKQLINQTKFELNKPSELCQVIFIQKFKKDYEIYKISPIQLDLMNGIAYKVREIIHRDNLVIDDEIPSTLFEIRLQDFTSLFSTYNNHDYRFLIEKMVELSDIKIIINALGKNKECEETAITRFIHEIRLSKHKHQKDQKIRIAVSNLIINKFINVKKYFSKMFFAIQFSMDSKYSKLLYELLKDYERIKFIEIPISNLFDLINVTEESQKKWSIFQGNILKKAVTEINEKSDIKVSYETFKEKPEGDRMQVTRIKFSIERQTETRLRELGIIQESISEHKFYAKSKSKLDKLVKGGYQVADSEMWIKTDIRKNEDRYESEFRIDVWLNNTDNQTKNEFFEELAKNLDGCDDPTVVIEDYKVVGLFSKDTFTKNPQETVELLNGLISQIGD